MPTPPRTAEVRAELEEIATAIEADLRDALSQISKITSVGKP